MSAQIRKDCGAGIAAWFRRLAEQRRELSRATERMTQATTSLDQTLSELGSNTCINVERRLRNAPVDEDRRKN